MLYQRKPIVIVFSIYLLCFAFRIWEYFVLRTDQTFWGEAFVHKLIGIGILCATVKMLSFSFGEIGFAKKYAAQDLTKGLLFGLSIFAVAYGVETVISILQENLLLCGGLWHIVAPIRNYYDGISSMGGMIASANSITN